MGGHPVSATLNHFRYDTKLDGVVIDQQNNDASILRGNGDGTFLTPGSYLVGNSPLGEGSYRYRTVPLPGNGNGKVTRYLSNG